MGVPYVCFIDADALITAALALEEFNFQRHTSGREVLRMLLYAVLENIGYHQLNDLWRMLALVDLARHKQGGARCRAGASSSDE